MTAAFVESQAVYTPQEIASVLRVSAETIRRKIALGELGALEVGGRERKQYRILAQDLVSWLGADRARALFGIGSAATEIRQALERVPTETLEAVLSEAVARARQEQPEPQGPFAPTPTLAEIAVRFPKSRAG